MIMHQVFDKKVSIAENKYDFEQKKIIETVLKYLVRNDEFVFAPLVLHRWIDIPIVLDFIAKFQKTFDKNHETFLFNLIVDADPDPDLFFKRLKDRIPKLQKKLNVIYFFNGYVNREILTIEGRTIGYIYKKKDIEPHIHLATNPFSVYRVWNLSFYCDN